MPWADAHATSWWAAGVFGGLALLCVLGSLVFEWFAATGWSERWRLHLLGLARGSAAFAVLTLAVVAGLPKLMELCSKPNVHAAGFATIVSSVVGVNYVAAIFTMITRKGSTLPLAKLLKPSWWNRLLPPAVLQLILVLLTFVLLASAWLIVLGGFAVAAFKQVAPQACGNGIPHPPDLGYWLLLAVAILGFADVTSLSLHPFYRSRLARTFAVRRLRLSGTWQAVRYPAPEWTWLDRYGRTPQHDGPRFIFAAAATLSGTATTAPGLDAVSYVLSADYIGGPELGWLNTPQLLAVAPPRIRQDLTVIASMAVSGAAFASAMGRQNKGYQKLLALSGARLGTWLPNPKLVGKLYEADNDAEQEDGNQTRPTPQGDCLGTLVCCRANEAPGQANEESSQPTSSHVRCPCQIVCPLRQDLTIRKDEIRPWPKSLPTIRGAGYFYRELLGINNDDARLVQVTDGGHYENLGLVEALRRRCRLIFCVDAGGDAPPLLSSLSDAMRLAEYELGVTIDLNKHGKFSIKDLAPGSGKHYPEDDALASLNSRITSGTVAYGTINYPSAAGLVSPQRRTGTLIFAKAVLWENCPEWLLTYAASSPLFPHDPTSDQWFNEAQFAAYTTLGRIMGSHALQCVKHLQR